MYNQSQHAPQQELIQIYKEIRDLDYEAFLTSSSYEELYDRMESLYTRVCEKSTSREIRDDALEEILHCLDQIVKDLVFLRRVMNPKSVSDVKREFFIYEFYHRMNFIRWLVAKQLN